MVLTMRGVGVACTVGRHDLGYVEGGGEGFIGKCGWEWWGVYVTTGDEQAQLKRRPLHAETKR